MIFAPVRDPRLVTLRRGGTLSDNDHRLLGLWAAQCAEHVLAFFDEVAPDDPRPRHAIEAVRAWTRGEMLMMESRSAGGEANGAARVLRGAAREAAHAAGQAGCVPHVADHALGAAAYAIRAVRSAARVEDREQVGRGECAWQRAQLPDVIRDLVLDDQRRRNSYCWGVFE